MAITTIHLNSKIFSLRAATLEIFRRRRRRNEVVCAQSRKIYVLRTETISLSHTQFNACLPTFNAYALSLIFGKYM